MKTELAMSVCFFCIVAAGILAIPSDVQARRMNPEEIRKQMEEAGVNVEDGQSREEQLEALRSQRGVSEGAAGGPNESKYEKKSAADVKIPAGTQVMVKLDKALDSSEIGEGEQFTGRLDADLVVDEFLLAARGSKVYGTIVTSTRARNVAGTSVLEFKLVGMTIDNQMRSIESSLIRVESEKSGRRQASASIDADKAVEFSIGETGSDVDQYGTQTISDPDKKASDRVEERRDFRRDRRN